MKNKLTALITAILIISILITGCSPKAKLKEGVIARVNGVEILEEEYNKLLDYYLSELRAKHDLTDDVLNKDIGTGMTLLDSLKSDVLETLIITQIIAEEAAKNNIEIDEEEFQQIFEENHLKLMEENEEYRKTIEDNNIDEEFIKSQMKKDWLGYQYKVFYLDNLEITDETARTFYDENGDMFHVEEIKARHILVDEEEEARDLIKRIEDGEDFAELAKAHSTEPGAEESGGDLGYFGQDVNFVPEFKEAAFALEVGEVSEPVKTEFGYHVILVEDKIEEHKDFEEVKEGIKYSLRESDYQNHISEIYEKADIVTRDEE